jgi:hypothetical protein
MVTQVIVKLVHDDFLGEFYFSGDKMVTAKNLLELNEYHQVCEFYTQLEGEAAAEEAFDLTNNPMRQEQRESVYGRRRSVSVGDIIVVNGVQYLCASTGWQVI